jgi:hypothetical protein
MWIERRLENDPDFPKPEISDPQRFWRITAIETYEQVCATRPRRRSA